MGDPRKTKYGRVVILGGAILIVVAAAWNAFAPRRSAAAARHPEPRAETTGAQMMPAAYFASYPRIRRAYDAARRSAATLDGVFCYCYCEQHAGHYSLADCFKSQHAAGCDVCLSEGLMVDQMHQQGASLDQIRQRIDATFGA